MPWYHTQTRVESLLPGFLISDLEKESEGAKWTPIEESSADFPRTLELRYIKLGVTRG